MLVLLNPRAPSLCCSCTLSWCVRSVETAAGPCTPPSPVAPPAVPVVEGREEGRGLPEHPHTQGTEQVPTDPRQVRPMLGLLPGGPGRAEGEAQRKPRWSTCRLAMPTTRRRKHQENSDPGVCHGGEELRKGVWRCGYLAGSCRRWRGASRSAGCSWGTARRWRCR